MWITLTAHHLSTCFPRLLFLIFRGFRFHIRRSFCLREYYISPSILVHRHRRFQSRLKFSLLFQSTAFATADGFLPLLPLRLLYSLLIFLHSFCWGFLRRLILFYQIARGRPSLNLCRRRCSELSNSLQVF